MSIIYNCNHTHRIIYIIAINRVTNHQEAKKSYQSKFEFLDMI